MVIKKVEKKPIEKKLIENFVSLQKVMTNLSEKISKLLDLFESSAEALAKKEINFTKPMDEAKIVGKLDKILDQNKIIARGVSLMHGQIGNESQLPPTKTIPKPLPTAPPSPKKEEYRKSPFSRGF